MADKNLTALTPSPDGMERRHIASDVRIETRDDATERSIAGYGIVYGARIDLGPFTEEIAPSVARRALDEAPSVLCMYNHSPDKLLARSDNGSLRLRSDDHGLHFTAKMPEGITYADDVYAAVQAGLVRGCSFWFAVREEEWDYSGEKPHRRITDIDLVELGPVAMPAYPTTSVSARALQRAADAPVTETAPEPEVTEPTVDTETQTALALLDIALAEVD